MTLDEAFKIVEGKYFGNYPFDESQWEAFEAIEAAAKRFQWMKSQVKIFSLDMGGQHTYVPNYAFSRLRGYSFEAAIDEQIKAKK